MTAITTRKDVRRQANYIGHAKLAPSTTIPEGALVGVNAQGLATNAAATSAAKVLGVASKTATAGRDGHVEFETSGVISVKAGFSAAAGDLGELVKVKDNQTVDKLGGGDDQKLICGRIVEVVSSTELRIALRTN